MKSLDPRARLIAILLLFGAPLCVQAPAWLALPVIALAVLVCAEGGAAAVRAFLPLLFIMSLANVVLWPAIVHGGPPLLGYLTTLGVIFGIGMALRLTAFALLGMLYLQAAPVEQTAWALTQLGLPYVVSFGIVTAFRLMERISRTTETVTAAQRSRGLTVENGSALQRWKSYVPLLVPILVLSMRRVDGLAMAMEARAFSPTGRRTSLLDYRMRARDWAVLLLAAGILGSALLMRWHGWGLLVAGRV